MPRHRSLYLPALCVTLGLSAAGCAGNSDASSSTATTSASPSTSVSATATATAPASGPIGGVKPGGEVAKATFAATLTKAMASAKSYTTFVETTVTRGGQTETSTIKGTTQKLNETTSIMDLSVDLGAGPIRTILMTDYAYMQMAPGAKYTRMTAAELSKTTGTNVRETLDPQASMKKTLGMISRVTYVGKDQVKNQATYLYRVQAKADAEMRANGTPATLSYDYWLDAQNRPVKTVVVLGNSETGDVITTGYMDDYDKPVSIEAPPASEILAR